MPERLARHDILFEEVPIGPRTLRNRFYQVPHCTGFGVEKPWTQAAFRGMKAEGGWAAVCTEYCSISPESDEKPYTSARLWDDEDMRALSLMADAAHENGALAGVELWHGGLFAEQRESRLPPLAPSQIASDWDGVTVPKVMEAADIRRVQDEWVAAARRARTAGFDILYVYGSHTYLPTQFLSPVFNRRTDAYGGSFENRSRFWLEAIERVKAEIGDDCAIAVRIAADTLELSGVQLEEGLEFIRAADPMVDLWDVTIGSMAGMGRLDAGPSRFYEQGYQLEWSGRAKEATSKPVVVVGRFTDPDRMAEVIRGGHADLIGAARPSISDPFLPRKIEEGRYDEVRECIGCNACYSRSVWGLHLGLHPEPDGGRGAPPRLASRAVRPGGERRQAGARRRRRAGRHGVRHGARKARVRARPPRRRRRRHRRPDALGDAGFRASGSGATSWPTGATQLDRLAAVEVVLGSRARRRRACATTAPGSSWSRRAPAGRATA